MQIPNEYAGIVGAAMYNTELPNPLVTAAVLVEAAAVVRSSAECVRKSRNLQRS